MKACQQVIVHDPCSAGELFKLDYFLPVTGERERTRSLAPCEVRGRPPAGSAPAAPAGMLRRVPLSSPGCDTPAGTCAIEHALCCIRSYAFIRARMSEQTVSAFRPYFHNRSLSPFSERSFSSGCRNLLFNVSENQLGSNTQNC